MMAAETSRLDAYIVLCLLTGCRVEEARALRWITWTWTVTQMPIRQARRTWPCGGPFGRTAT